MKTIQIYITIALFFVVIVLQAQTPSTILKEGNYTVTGTESLTATRRITLKPNSWIKPGSNFNAVIQPATYQNVILDENENYVFTRIFQEGMSATASINENSDVIESVTYFDGLGRPQQQIRIKASPRLKDVVTHIGYDDYGRLDKEYLPFERQSGALGTFTTVDISTNISDYYKNKYPEDFEGAALEDVNAYSENVFEPSPLNRVVEQGAPGKDWKVNREADTDHTIKFDWDTNNTSEVVYFKVNFHMENTEVPILVKEGFYEPNELFVTITKDENWQPGQSNENDHTTSEYKDKLGRVILKRTYNQNVPHDTYYAYDDFGNLTYVIPPKVDITDGVSNTELTELCYQYKYDNRNRLVEKKIPGKGWEYIIYNKLDRPVMTQDVIQRPKKEWLFTKYDAYGRIAYTGLHLHSFVTTRAGLQQNAFTNSDLIQYETKENDASIIAGTTIYYSENAYPDAQLLYTINYYDTYTFDHTVSNPGTVFGQTVATNVKGLATGTKVRVLETDHWITTVTYYDQKGRPIYVHSTNPYLETVDIIETKLDFVGKVLQTKTTHIKGSNLPIVTLDMFTYDHMGRLLTQTQKINDQAAEQIVSNTYDELGQLETKEVGGGLQDVDYSYNVRGWLTGINDVDAEGDRLFSFKINYNTIEGLYATPGSYHIPGLYNGNIAQTIWKTANDNTKRSYAYQYDALNRITSAKSTIGATLMSGTSFSVSGISYDKNGNIESIIRSGDPTGYLTNHIDDLRYSYSNNKLLKVDDVSTSVFKNEGFKDGTNTDNDYAYDLNGNMIEDKNKGITDITYNHLNLPTGVEVDGNDYVGYIQYTYDATGVKLRKRTQQVGMPSATVNEYAGNYIYKNGTLEFSTHSEGYIEPTDPSDLSKGFAYIYQYKDHLGNIRLSYSDTNKDGVIAADTEIIEEKNYYPFGLAHVGYNSTISGREHPYGFNGIELTEDLNLNLYEMDWRQYDPAIGRFTSIDPYAKSFSDLTPYHYSYNSPVMFSDPSGLFSTVINEEGIVLDHKDDGDTNIYLNSRSGQIVGEEEEGKEYNIGDKIYNVDDQVDTFFELVLERNKVQKELKELNKDINSNSEKIRMLKNKLNKGEELSIEEKIELVNLVDYNKALSSTLAWTIHKSKKLAQLFEAYQTSYPPATYVLKEASINGVNSAVNFFYKLWELGNIWTTVEIPDGEGQTAKSKTLKQLKEDLGLRPATTKKKYQELPYTLDYHDD